MIPLCCLLVEPIEILASLRLLSTILCLHLDSSLFCEYLDRLSEVDLLDLHEKVDRSSSLATREAMSNVFGRRYDKWWTLLIVKRTESLVINTCLLGRYIPIDDIEYLDTRFDVLSNCHWVYFLMTNSIWSTFPDTDRFQNGYELISTSLTCPVLRSRVIASVFVSQAIVTLR